MEHGRERKDPQDAGTGQPIASSLDSAYSYASSASRSGYDMVRDFSAISHLSRPQCPVDQPLSPSGPFEQTDGGAATSVLSTELERRYGGQHPLLHSSHFSYAMGSLPGAVPPLCFPDALDYTRLGMRSVPGQSSGSLGMAVSRFGLDRSEGVPYQYDRGQVGGFIGQGHPLFGAGQAGASLPPIPSFSASSKEDSPYFGVTSHLSIEESLARVPSTDVNQYSRGRLSTSPQSGRRSTYEEGSQLTHHRDNFPSSSAPDSSPFFVSGQRSSPQVTSPHPGPDTLENYSMRQGPAVAEARSQLDTSARYQSHFSSSVPSYIPLGTGPNYVYCNPPRVSSVRSFNNQLPQSSYNSSSPLDRLSGSDLPMNAPPPAHSAPPAHAHVHDALLQRCGFGEEAKKQFSERELYEGSLPNSLSHTMQSRNSSSYDHSNAVISPKGDSFDSVAEEPGIVKEAHQKDNIHLDEDHPSSRLPDTKIKTEIFEREAELVHQDSSFHPSKLLYHNDKFQASETQDSEHVPGSITTPTFNERNGKEDSCVGAHSENGNAETGSDGRFYAHQKFQKKFLTHSHSSLNNFNTVQYAQDIKKPALEEGQSQRQHCGREQLAPFSITPSIHTDSSEDETQEEFANTKTYEDGIHHASENIQVQNSKLVFPKLEESPPFSSQSKISSPIRKASGNEFAETEVKLESEHYDSSTSEYEPPSPPNQPAKYSAHIFSSKKDENHEHCSSSFVEEPALGAGGGPPRIKLIIRKEKVKPLKKFKIEATTHGNLKVTRRPRSKPLTTVLPTGGMPKPKRGNRTCPICNKVFSRADSLTCHMRVHTGDRPYVCEFCSASYKVSSHLKDHVRSKHTNSVPYECSKCHKGFTYATARRRHEKVCGVDLSERVEFQCANCEKGFVTAKGYEKHTMKCVESGASLSVFKDERFPFRCTACSKSYESFPGLDRHMRFFCGRSPQKGRYVCEECGKVFLKRNRYISHTRRHVGDKPFKCQKCTACFYDKRTLRRHLEQHDGNKKFKCTLCSASYFYRNTLSLHATRAHCGKNPYKCCECEFDFSSGYDLSRHVRHVHKREKRFKCPRCFQGFFEPSSWVKHMSLHAPPPQKSIRLAKARRLKCKVCQKFIFKKDFGYHMASEHPDIPLHLAMTKQLLQCSLCFRSFSCSNSLQVHMLRHTGVKPFRCYQCHKGFMLKSVLILHQLQHTHYQPFGCSKCGQLFRWKSSLTQHMLYQHNVGLDGRLHEDVITCKECGMGFKQHLSLKVHMKKHCDIMPHVCNECGKGFGDLSRLKIHMSQHDGPKPFSCDTCGAGYFYQYLLDDHIRQKHSGLPKKKWLCEECGKSLSRRDSLLHHMALHAKYPGGKIPNKGRRKGSSVSKKQPRKPRKKKLSDLMSIKTEEYKDDTTCSSAATRVDAGTNAGLAAEHRLNDFSDFSLNSAGQPNWNIQAQQSLPYQYNTYIHNTLPWPTQGER